MYFDFDYRLGFEFFDCNFDLKFIGSVSNCVNRYFTFRFYKIVISISFLSSVFIFPGSSIGFEYTHNNMVV